MRGSSGLSAGKLNASDNCLDRHLQTSHKDKPAILWEGEAGEKKVYTYEDLHREVCRFSRALRRLGVQKGDRITIFLPMIPELPIAMLACARLGAVHSVVFSDFSPDSLRERIRIVGLGFLLPATYALDCGRLLPLKQKADVALESVPA